MLTCQLTTLVTPNQTEKMPETDEKSIHLAKLRMPTFSTKHPSIWFRRVEAAFKNSGVTVEDTKCNCILEAIPESVIESIAPWLDGQPDTLDYAKLKARILKVYAPTPQQRVDRLLQLPAQMEQQDDVSPSQVWHEINSLLTNPDGSKINFARELWRRSLNQSVRATTRTGTTDPSEAELDAADQQAEILGKALPATNVCAARNRQPPEEQQPKPYVPLNKLKDGICGYHRKFGDKATKCAPGCTHKSKN